MKSQNSDFIVVGSGIAGLRAAMELAKAGSVCLFCKGEPWQSNTRWAQGGIAAAMQEGDTVEFHLQDTLQAGDGLCYEPAARVLVEEGPHRIEELVAWGAQFDQVAGKFVFGREGAHSRSRILHSGDATGKEIVRALLNGIRQARGIEIIPNMPAVDLLIESGKCRGIIAMNENKGEIFQCSARAVLLAAGGAGQIYSHTTNPSAATGDGVAMAYRAGCELMDLEFFQFHPTAFHRAGAPRFLLTEALRGEGAMLRNINDKAFMKNYHELGDLAPRDVVSRAIVSELQKTGAAWVYLDATAISRRKLRDRFPNICEFLQNYELDPAVDLIPVSPSAHYWMGGVRTDLQGRTSIPGLFAAGEVACNGVHGANRLASNSLLEGLVFGARAGKTMLHEAAPHLQSCLPREFETDRMSAPASEIRQKLQDTNWREVGLIRTQETIRKALQFLNELPIFQPSNVEELELLNLIDCSKLMGSFALERRESRGSHYREDFPSKNLQWNGHHTVLRKSRIVIEEIS